MTAGFLALLRPAGPWRLGHASGARDRVDRICHSDQLFAAVTHALDRLGMREEWLAAAAEGSVRLSSCFPFQGKTLYVTPPQSLWPPPPSAKVRWEGAKFVPLSLVTGLLSDQALDESRWRVDGSSECLLPRDRSGDGPLRTAVRWSAAIDRLDGTASPHGTACLEFGPNSGMWSAVAFTDDAARLRWTEPMKGAFRLLADTGIGGERSRGWGRFEAPEFREGSFPALLSPAPALESDSAWWLLSVYQPAETDGVDWSRGRYNVIQRGGRVESDAGWGAEKQQSRMVAEGSVLISDFPLRGQTTDVAPPGFPHPVLRSGLAFALPIAWKVTGT